MKKNTAEAVANEMAAQGYKPILAHATRDTGIKTWEVWGTDPDTLASVMVATREEWDQHVSDKAHANAVDYCAEHFTGAVSVLAVELADAIKRAEAAEKERDRLALQVRASSTDDDDLTLSNLQEDTNDVLDSLDKTAIKGAINWADLRCVSATQVHGNRGRTWFRVEIEEAAPGEEALIAAVVAGLAAKGWYMDDIEITTEW